MWIVADRVHENFRIASVQHCESSVAKLFGCKHIISITKMYVPNSRCTISLWSSVNILPVRLSCQPRPTATFHHLGTSSPHPLPLPPLPPHADPRHAEQHHHLRHLPITRPLHGWAPHRNTHLKETLPTNNNHMVYRVNGWVTCCLLTLGIICMNTKAHRNGAL